MRDVFRIPFIFALLFNFAIASDDLKTTAQIDKKLELSLSVGRLNAKSGEYVYESNGDKLSQLDWETKNAAILKFGMSYDYNPLITAKASFWKAISKGDSQMDDYDWLVSNQSSPSHHSWHDDTRLEDAHEIDVCLIGWFGPNKIGNVGVVAGYQYNKFKWAAYGGKYSYLNGSSVGSFPNGQKVISYEQKFYTPYLGLAGFYKIGKFEINGLFKYSMWAYAEDKDEHHLRDLTYKEEANERSKYKYFSLGAAYNITKSSAVSIEGAYSKHDEAKAKTIITNNNTGVTTTYSGDVAGISNEYSILQIGYRHSF